MAHGVFLWVNRELFGLQKGADLLKEKNKFCIAKTQVKILIIPRGYPTLTMGHFCWMEIDSGFSRMRNFTSKGGTS